jgi:hypothetical protein
VDGAELRVPPGDRVDGRGQGAAGAAGHVPERPQVRGVTRSSQAPTSTRAVLDASRVNAPTRLVFPIPASPETQHDRASTLPGPPECLPQPTKLGVPLE